MGTHSFFRCSRASNSLTCAAVKTVSGDIPAKNPVIKNIRADRSYPLMCCSIHCFQYRKSSSGILFTSSQIGPACSTYMITDWITFSSSDTAAMISIPMIALLRFFLIGAGSRYGSDAGIRLVLLGLISLISTGSGISSLTSLMLVLLSPAYAGFSIVYSIGTPSCSARRLINTSMIFSIFTCTTSLKCMRP